MGTVFKKELTPMKELARAFSAKELAPNIREHDRHPFAPLFMDTLEKAYEAGFFGVVIPEELGGAGGDLETLCVLLEEISSVDASLGAAVFTNACAQLTAGACAGVKAAGALMSGAASVREAILAFPCYLHPVIEAETLPRAELSPGGQEVLSGTVPLLSLATVATRAVVPARGAHGDDVSFFLVDLDRDEVTKSGPVLTLGFHACPAADVTLDRVPALRLCSPDKGSEAFGSVYAALLVASAAISAGIMRGSYECALAYAVQRRQGGREIARWSEVTMMLADMLIAVRSSGLALAQASRLALDGDASSMEYAASAALTVHSLACGVVSDGIQVLGGYGYMKDYGQEKRYRDAHQASAVFGSHPLKKLSLVGPAVKTASLGQGGMP
ncbi:MAG TPA: acyl-CoA dehydrogenase family protein [Deltaproteobacteria bacterium]|nr:acyl-CoA dehydrogenase family protein [Deltaproteobacteria bacterium]HPP79520.1 acyl-CoA dehydrogenase family protein [Deltaproteobacteria bacterium]